MSVKKQQAIASAAAVGILLAACGKKDDSKSTTNIEATSLSELKLSSSLKVDLPDSLKKAGGNTASLALNTLQGKRSREACQAVRDIDMLLSNLSAASAMVCHLEAESAQMKFGTKYKVNITDGEGDGEDFRIWVDNSAADKLTVYSCEGTTLTQKIVIDGSNSSGSSGTIDFGSNKPGANVAMKLAFDFRDQAVGILKGQFTFDDGQGMSFAADNDLLLRENGVSSMKVSQNGAFGGDSFKRMGVVKSNGTFGQALMSIDFIGGSIRYRESFDGEGFALDDPSTVAEEVKIDKTELPAALPADYSIAGLEGWDCAVDETITVDMVSGSTAAAHNACEADNSHDEADEVSCDGADFEYGEIEND